MPSNLLHHFLQIALLDESLDDPRSTLITLLLQAVQHLEVKSLVFLATLKCILSELLCTIP